MQIAVSTDVTKGDPLETQTDEELVEALRLGRNDAFEVLYRRYKRHVYSYCLKLTGNKLLAEDATHDAFMRMYSGINELRDLGLFRSWLFALTRNGIYKQLRRTRTNGMLDEESVWENETPQSVVEQDDLKTIVETCLDALKSEYKEVLYLREYEDRSYDEIAMITGDSISSVKSRLFKARKALAEKLKPYLEE